MDTDLLTMGEATDALRGIRGVTRDADIALYVSAVSQRIDSLCGPVVARAHTEQHRGGVSFDLDFPLFEMTSVTTRTGTAVTTIDVDDLVIEGRTVTRPYNPFVADERAVTVTYLAGRVETTADVPAIFKLAARLYLQAIWRPAEGGGSETFGGLPGIPATVPDDVLAILGSELRAPTVA